MDNCIWMLMKKILTVVSQEFVESPKNPRSWSLENFRRMTDLFTDSSRREDGHWYGTLLGLGPVITRWEPTCGTFQPLESHSSHADCVIILWYRIVPYHSQPFLFCHRLSQFTGTCSTYSHILRKTTPVCSKIAHHGHKQNVRHAPRHACRPQA